MLVPVIAQLRRGELPVRVRAWDGNEAGADQRTELTGWARSVIHCNETELNPRISCPAQSASQTSPVILDRMADAARR